MEGRLSTSFQRFVTWASYLTVMSCAGERVQWGRHKFYFAATAGLVVSLIMNKILDARQGKTGENMTERLSVFIYNIPWPYESTTASACFFGVGREAS